MAPLLPLDIFRKILAYNPFHFWQLTNTLVPLTDTCNALVFKYAWQNVGAIGREEVLYAIEMAEARLTEYLGYSPIPHYVSETHPYPRYPQNDIWYYPQAGSDGRNVSIHLGEGYINEIGTEKLTLIGDTSVTITDTDNDGIADFFTATINTTETDISKIAVYFTTADRLHGEPIGDYWRIQPVTVSISGGVATIKGNSWLLVSPILYEGMSDLGLDPNDATTYVDTISVYIRETDTTNQATLIWEPLPCELATLCGSATSISSSAGIRNAVQGIAYIDGSCTTSIGLCRPPDKVIINYNAGIPLINQRVRQSWCEIISRLAMAEIPKQLCSCDKANQNLYYWQFDLARTGGANDEIYSLVSRADLDNPFGTRRGQIYAWKNVRNLRKLTGIAL